VHDRLDSGGDEHWVQSHGAPCDGAYLDDPLNCREGGGDGRDGRDGCDAAKRLRHILGHSQPTSDFFNGFPDHDVVQGFAAVVHGCVGPILWRGQDPFADLLRRRYSGRGSEFLL
jgi:hypothetical protein